MSTLTTPTLATNTQILLATLSNFNVQFYLQDTGTGYYALAPDSCNPIGNNTNSHIIKIKGKNVEVSTIIMSPLGIRQAFVLSLDLGSTNDFRLYNAFNPFSELVFTTNPLTQLTEAKMTYSTVSSCNCFSNNFYTDNKLDPFSSTASLLRATNSTSSVLSPQSNTLTSFGLELAGGETFPYLIDTGTITLSSTQSLSWGFTFKTVDCPNLNCLNALSSVANLFTNPQDVMNFIQSAGSAIAYGFPSSIKVIEQYDNKERDNLKNDKIFQY